MLSTASLKPERDGEFLMWRGRGFQSRMVEGKYEWRWWSFMERGTKKLNGRRGELVGTRKDLSAKHRSLIIL